ncbi:MAG: hypothetical protein AAB428_03550 [Patescibacteria group bacterium]
MNPKTNTKSIAIAGIFAAFVVVSLFLNSLTYTEKPFVAKTIKKDDRFANIEIEAKAAIVWDVKENKVLFSKNKSAQLPIASLAKLMTTLVALNEEKGVAIVNQEAIKEEGDSGLLAGEKWKIQDLAKLTLVASANDGASSLSNAWLLAKSANTETAGNRLFVDAMNEEAKSLRLSETYFLNETGLDVSAALSGGYSSAENIARLFYHATVSYPEVFEATGQKRLSVESLENKTHTVKNTNEYVEQFPGIVASKTGFTDLAGGNLAVIIDIGINHPVVAVVLGSTTEGRFIDAKKLIEATISVVGNSRQTDMIN